MAVWHFAIERVPNKEGEIYKFTKDWEKDKEKFIYHWIDWKRENITYPNLITTLSKKKNNQSY